MAEFGITELAPFSSTHSSEEQSAKFLLALENDLSPLRGTVEVLIGGTSLVLVLAAIFVLSPSRRPGNDRCFYRS